MGSSFVTVFMSLLQAIMVLGSGYELKVMVHAYRNPTGTCQDCFASENQTQPGCCDRHFEIESCNGDSDLRCDNFFSFCQRTIRTPANDTACPVLLGPRQVSNAMLNSDNVAFGEDVFGLANPILFTGTAWQGIQVFVEVFDDDSSLGIDLVDVFALDIDTSPGPNFTNVVTYSGFYGIGEIDLSFQLMCSENFYGPMCVVECVPVDDSTGHFTCDSEGNRVCISGFTGINCVDVDDCVDSNCGENQVCIDLSNSFICDCLPGFSGPGCTVNVDDCVGVDCGMNQQCVDGINSHSCECVPGFVGEDCLTNCTGIDCGNGVCRDGNESFICDCIPGYTGRNCSIDINECEENNCSGNFQCVDGIATFTCTCNPGFTGENCTPEESRVAPQLIGGVMAGVGGAALIAVLVAVLVVCVGKRKLKPKDDDVLQDQNHIYDVPQSTDTNMGNEQSTQQPYANTTSYEIILNQNPVYDDSLSGGASIKMQRNQVYELSKATSAGHSEYDYVAIGM